jgi:hypothetical protein
MCWGVQEMLAEKGWFGLTYGQHQNTHEQQLSLGFLPRCLVGVPQNIRDM